MPDEKDTRPVIGHTMGGVPIYAPEPPIPTADSDTPVENPYLPVSYRETLERTLDIPPPNPDIE